MRTDRQCPKSGEPARRGTDGCGSRRAISLPYVFVDFSGRELAGLTEITSLDAPHRVYDAILRDSLLAGEPFMKSQLGRRLAETKPSDASALLEVSPTALLFGAWHSTGEGGGLGAKFARCLVSEIIGINVPTEFFDAGNTASATLPSEPCHHCHKPNGCTCAQEPPLCRYLRRGLGLKTEQTLL